MIWDTGEYSILPYHRRQKNTDDEDSCLSDSEHHPTKLSDNEKLRIAFQNVRSLSS